MKMKMEREREREREAHHLNAQSHHGGGKVPRTSALWNEGHEHRSMASWLSISMKSVGPIQMIQIDGLMIDKGTDGEWQNTTNLTRR